MENSAPTTLSPLVAALFFLANTFTAALSSLLTQFFLRRKQTADIARSGSLNYKTEAEAREIDSRIIAAAHVQLAEFAAALRHKTAEQDEDRRLIANQAWELSLAEQREKLLDQQVRLAHAELEVLRKPRV